MTYYSKSCRRTLHHVGTTGIPFLSHRLVPDDAHSTQLQECIQCFLCSVAGQVDLQTARRLTWKQPVRRVRFHVAWQPLSPAAVLTSFQFSVEDFPAGYPRYSALIAAHEPFFICRGFRRLRARLLLLKQDKLADLEQRLDRIDQEEQHLLFLGKLRCDGNPERAALLSEIEISLREYDELVGKTRDVLGCDPALPRDVLSLRNWTAGTGAIARAETEYLETEADLIRLDRPGDMAAARLNMWVTTQLIRWYRGFRKSKGFDVSTDPNVYIYSGTLLMRISRIVLLLLVALLLLLPVIICNFVTNASGRVFIVTATTVIFLIILMLMAQPKTLELVTAGATYATVVTVFVTNNAN